MGMHNRPYWRDSQDDSGGGRLTMGLPPIGRVVKYLLIINLAVFVLQLFFDTSTRPGQMSLLLGASVDGWWQVWRYVTFQFLHSPENYWHIMMNMLGLYLIGSPLEQHWGARRFLRFYLGCGAFAGMVYVAALALLAPDLKLPIIGASGGVYAIVLACAVLFPQFKLILLFFPVPIRLAALLIFGGMVFVILTSLRSQDYYQGRFWSDVCHMGGAAAAAFYLWVAPAFEGARLGRMFQSGGKPGSGKWKRRMEREAAEQAEIDKILQKIHEQGVGSLTPKEKKRLQDATRRQQAREREFDRR